MTAVELSEDLVRNLRGFAEGAYPEECCGFLLSTDGDGRAAARCRIVDAEPAPNEAEGERRRRFAIAPGELRAAEERAARRGREVRGFYHSHPDHPARPSQIDQDHAWPWYTYVVLSIGLDGIPGEIGAFELDPSRREFRALPLRVLPRPGPSAPASG